LRAVCGVASQRAASPMTCAVPIFRGKRPPRPAGATMPPRSAGGPSAAGSAPRKALPACARGAAAPSRKRKAEELDVGGADADVTEEEDYTPPAPTIVFSTGKPTAPPANWCARASVIPGASLQSRLCLLP
jgi:hypothetical protein